MEKRQKKKVALSFDLNDADDDDYDGTGNDDNNLGETATPPISSTRPIFKPRRKKLSSFKEKPRLETSAAINAADKDVIMNDIEDDELEEDTADIQIFKINRRVRGNNVSKSQVQKKDDDSIGVDSTGEKAREGYLLSKYADSVDANDDHDDNVPIDIEIEPAEDDTTLVKETIPKILDASTMQELKDRRYRAQSSEFADMKLEDRLGDKDEEFYRSRHIDRDENDDKSYDIEKDATFNDGRLAYSTKEIELQNKLHKEEIEEMIYNLELENEESESIPESDGKPLEQLISDLGHHLKILKGVNSKNQNMIDKLERESSSIKLGIGSILDELGKL